VCTTEPSGTDYPADLVERDFTAGAPDRLWVADLERHEAFSDRAVVKGHRLMLVAASHFEAGGSLIPGTRVRVDSSPDNDGTD